MLIFEDQLLFLLVEVVTVPTVLLLPLRLTHQLDLIRIPVIPACHPSHHLPKDTREHDQKSKSKSRKSEQCSQNAGLKTGLDIQQEQGPFFYSPEGRNAVLLKTPIQSASSTALATISPGPLLPPVELYLPSLPPTATTSHIQRRSRGYTTNEVV